MPGPALRRATLSAGCAAMLVMLAFGIFSAHAKPLPVAKERAVQIAAQAPKIRAQAAAATSTAVERVDDRLERVTFLRAGRVVASAGVRRDGSVLEPLSALRHQGYGATVSHSPLAFVLLATLFLVATLRRPLRLLASLDAAALAAFAIPTLLVDRGYVAVGQGGAALLLAYIAVRGATIVMRGAPAVRGRPLVQLASAPRLPLLLAGAVALAVVATTLCSTGEVDVAYASMEGATNLLHGVLPYGHLPGDVIHGDTYGLPAYAAYVPVAALWPVASTWDEVTGALVLAAVCALVGAWGVARALGGDRATGLLVALAFPPALLAVTSGTNDVVIAAALAWALLWSARPARSAGLVAFAGLAKIAPLALLPAWIARARGRDRLRAIAASGGVCAAVVAVLVTFGGIHGPIDMAHAIAFQLERRSLSSIYVALGIGAVQPFVQAFAVGLAVGGATLFALDDHAARDPRRLAALCAGVLAVLQLAAHYWAPLYLLWLLPPAAIALVGGPGTAPAQLVELPQRRGALDEGIAA